MKGEVKISINKEWAKRVKKADFIKNLEKAYPDTDLGALYDEINPSKKKNPEKDDLG